MTYVICFMIKIIWCFLHLFGDFFHDIFNNQNNCCFFLSLLYGHVDKTQPTKQILLIKAKAPEKMAGLEDYTPRKLTLLNPIMEVVWFRWFSGFRLIERFKMFVFGVCLLFFPFKMVPFQRTCEQLLWSILSIESPSLYFSNGVFLGWIESTWDDSRWVSIHPKRFLKISCILRVFVVGLLEIKQACIIYIMVINQFTICIT